MAGVVAGAEPVGNVAVGDPFGRGAGEGAGLGDVAGDQGEAEFRGEAQVGGVGAADDLSAELDQPSVGEFGLFDASADPVPGLDDEDVGSAGGEAGQAGAEHDDVVVHGGVLR